MSKNIRSRLADFILENINLDISIILEVGCGEGQLTIPFTNKISKYIKDFKVVAYDLSIGPYSKSIDILKKKIQQAELLNLITIIQGDVRKIDHFEDNSVDFIFSNDLFCDLDRIGLEKALNEFYRILRKNGQMVHAEYSPAYENISQKLFIEADMHSLETALPRPDWFSPFSDELAALMHKVGFRDITIKYFETGLRYEYEKAIEVLRNWTVDPKFIEEHKKDLRKYGIESPLEHVIFCTKY